MIGVSESDNVESGHKTHVKLDLIVLTVIFIVILHEAFGRDLNREENNEENNRDEEQD